MQFEYAVLQFEDLHIFKKAQKLLNKPYQYNFFINEHFEKIIFFGI